MRIAFIVGSFPELSTPFILDQITGLIDRGHDVHVFARRPLKNEPVHRDFVRYGLSARTHYLWGGARAISDTAARSLMLLKRDPKTHAALLSRILLPALRPFAPGVERRMWSHVAAMRCEPRFDVVVAQFGTNGRLALRMRELGAFAAPLATTFLGYDLTRVVREHGPGYYADLFARGDLMLPLGECFRRRLIELGCSPEKIIVHRLGVKARAFEFSPRSLRPGEVPRLLSICRLVEKKGLDFALQALARVAGRGVAFEYHVIGDGPLRARLEASCARLGLRARVVFHGPMPRERVLGMLARGHVFLSPSVTASDGDQEGTPVAIMEAMSSGLPVISCVHSAIPELIRDEHSGHLVPEWDVAQLAERIERVLSRPERWPALAEAARETIEREHDVDVLNDVLAQRLTALAHRAHQARA